VIPDTRNNVVRPFLLTAKAELVSWCERKGLEWCEDTSNQDDKYMRNYIRKHVIPHTYHVNPGIEKVVKRMILDACQPE
jgi:tRNA(Ile)-lysidine synthase